MGRRHGFWPPSMRFRIRGKTPDGCAVLEAKGHPQHITVGTACRSTSCCPCSLAMAASRSSSKTHRAVCWNLVTLLQHYEGYVMLRSLRTHAKAPSGRSCAVWRGMAGMLRSFAVDRAALRKAPTEGTAASETLGFGCFFWLLEIVPGDYHCRP